MLTRRTIALACPLLALAGCGNSRTPVPDIAPPATPAALNRARWALLAAIRARERTVTVPSSAVTRVAGAWAIAVAARERIGGRLRRVISTHVYIAGAELVLDEYAPPAQYAAVAASVFAPVLHSLALLPVAR